MFVMLECAHVPGVGFRVGPRAGHGGEVGQEEAVAVGTVGHHPIGEGTAFKPGEQTGELIVGHDPAVDAVPLLSLAVGGAPSSAVVVIGGLLVEHDPFPALAVGSYTQFIEVGQVVWMADPLVNTVGVRQRRDGRCQRMRRADGRKGGVVGFVAAALVPSTGERVPGRGKGGIDVKEQQLCRSGVFGGVVLTGPMGVPVVRQPLHQFVEGHPLVLLADPFGPAARL